MVKLYETDSCHITIHARENYDRPFRSQEKAMIVTGFCMAAHGSNAYPPSSPEAGSSGEPGEPGSRFGEFREAVCELLGGREF